MVAARPLSQHRTQPGYTPLKNQHDGEQTARHVNICLHKTVRVFDVTKEKKHPLHSPNSSIFT